MFAINTIVSSQIEISKENNEVLLPGTIRRLLPVRYLEQRTSGTGTVFKLRGNVAPHTFPRKSVPPPLGDLKGTLTVMNEIGNQYNVKLSVIWTFLSPISCHHFRQKIVTSSQILWLKYTKFNFRLSPNGVLTTLPRPANWLWRGHHPQASSHPMPSASQASLLQSPLLSGQFKHWTDNILNHDGVCNECRSVSQTARNCQQCSATAPTWALWLITGASILPRPWNKIPLAPSLPLIFPFPLATPFPSLSFRRGNYLIPSPSLLTHVSRSRPPPRGNFFKSRCLQVKLDAFLGKIWPLNRCIVLAADSLKTGIS